jgi:transposase-like protein
LSKPIARCSLIGRVRFELMLKEFQCDFSCRSEVDYPYLVVDAYYEYVQEDGQVESDGVLQVKGVREDGHREILSVFVAPTEEEATWSPVFADLRRRELDAN